MTNMQLEYSKLMETRRHNEQQEELGKRELQVKQNTLDESIRHNLVTEALSQSELNATIDRWLRQDTETMRHNLATESEINRHNVATEQQAIADNNVKIALAKFNAAVNERIAAENRKSQQDIAKLNAAVTTAGNELKAKTELYKTATSNLLKRAELEQTKTRITAEVQKIAADTDQIRTNIEYAQTYAEAAERTAKAAEATAAAKTRDQDLKETKDLKYQVFKGTNTMKDRLTSTKAGSFVFEQAMEAINPLEGVISALEKLEKSRQGKRTSGHSGNTR